MKNLPDSPGTGTSIGTRGETDAAQWLEEHGCTVLFRNWRTRVGEVDIIALDGETLIFAEVKTWPHGCADTLEHALGAPKQKRIVETAKRFLSTYREYSNRYIRFDVLLVDFPDVPQRIYHIVSAFSECV